MTDSKAAEATPSLDLEAPKLLWRRGKRESALTSLRTQLRFRPEDAEGWYLYANWSQAAGRPGAAAEAIRIALDLQPARVDSLELLYRLQKEGELFAPGEVSKRRADFSSAIGAEPQFHLAALDYVIPRRDETALRAIAVGPRPVAAVVAARALEALGFPGVSEAAPLLSKSDALVADAVLSLALGRTAVAVRSLRELESSELPVASMRRALIRSTDAGRYSRVSALAKEYLRARPNNKWAQRVARTAAIARLVEDFEALESANGLHVAVSSTDERRLGRLLVAYQEFGRPIRVNALLSASGGEPVVGLGRRRAMARDLAKLGYLRQSSRLFAGVAAESGVLSDSSVSDSRDAELSFMENPFVDVNVTVPEDWQSDAGGPALHIVGKALPETQTGYTLRTQHSLNALVELGTDVAVGVLPLSGGGAAEWKVEGVPYYGAAVPARNRAGSDAWMRAAVDSLSDIVARVRPSVLHAHSDFYNAVAAEIVGGAFGIPVVYESRGFWEETWMSRTARQIADTEAEADAFEDGPLPEAYSLRQRAESMARVRSGRVLTLARVMRDHMESLDGEGFSEPGLVPNAVDPALSRQPDHSADIRSDLGFTPDDVVIGYVSSLVEYEGVEVLIDGFRELKRRLPAAAVKLLVVGDGPEREKLQRTAKRYFGSDTVFTGRVHHSEVADYYRAIDIFVVPRVNSKVTELVTPLKPFEAMALARPVVVSNVPALLEIAEDSGGAAKSFIADDAKNLAEVLEPLVLSKELRDGMGEQARDWVLENRTWVANAQVALDVYHDLGAFPDDPLVSWAEEIIHDHGLDPEVALAEVQKGDLPPAQGWFHLGGSRQSVEELRKDGWKSKRMGTPPIDLFNVEDWGMPGHRERSWGFDFQGWEFVEPFITEYDKTGDLGLLRDAARIAASWTDYVRRGPADDSMVWYDMSLAVRTPLAIALLSRLARAPEFHRQAIVLLAAVLINLDELKKSASFKPGNNHGFYAATSQAHAARFLPEWPATTQASKQSQERMAQVIHRQFGDDGGHLEHSPGYHEMLLRSFEDAAALGLVTDADTLQALRRAENVLGWMMLPDGKLAQFGDTTEVDMTRKPRASVESTRFLQSRGRDGRPAEERTLVLPSSGLAVVRAPQPQSADEIGTEAYLAMQAGFHSRAHKHADDLTIIWYDLGRQILVDGGRFGYGKNLASDDPLRKLGYFYESKERQYIESTIAHNTIELDGRIQDRRREPYGVLPIEASEKDGVFTVVGNADHVGWRHERTLTLVPHESLVVVDRVVANDVLPHEATVWFNFNGDFLLVEEHGGPDGVRFDIGDSTRLTVDLDPACTLVPPVIGQEEPLRGWRSPKDKILIACWSMGAKIDFNGEVQMRSEFRIGGNK